MLSHFQAEAFALVFVALGIAGLLTVIVWPLRDRPVDRGGFR